MKTLETDRLILRDWQQGDLGDLYEYAKSPNIGPNAGWKPHESLEESQTILNKFIERGDVWAMVERGSGKVIGSLGVHPDRKRDLENVRMIGYVLSEDYWGCGLMTEAVSRVLTHLFEDIGLDLVSVYHYSFNARSRRVIEKAGFTPEGVLRHAVRLLDGQIVDDVLYSITREEYFKRRG